VDIAPNDVLVFYTDVSLKASTLRGRNSRGTSVRSRDGHADGDAQQILEAVVHAWTDSLRPPPFDDLTMVVVKRFER